MATKLVGVLTAGGDTPGLNAALRGLGKAALGEYGMHLIMNGIPHSGYPH